MEIFLKRKQQKQEMRKVGHWSEEQNKKILKRVPPENLKIKRPLKVNYVYLIFIFTHMTHFLSISSEKNKKERENGNENISKKACDLTQHIFFFDPILLPLLHTRLFNKLVNHFQSPKKDKLFQFFFSPLTHIYFYICVQQCGMS